MKNSFATTIPDAGPELSADEEVAESRALWKPEYIDIARQLCGVMGCTELEVAEILGVSRRTTYRWKQTSAEFAEAMKVGKAPTDEGVKQSLLQRARGFYHRAQKVVHSKNGPMVVDYTEYVPPDTVACIFWLKNRMPEQFRDVKAIEHSGAIRQVHSIEEMSDERIKDELRAVDAALAEEGNAGNAGGAGGGKTDPSSVH